MQNFSLFNRAYPNIYALDFDLDSIGIYIYELVLVCEIRKSAQCHIDRAKCIS